MATVRWAHPVGTARWVTRGEAPSSDHRTKPRKAKPQAQTTATGTAKPRNGRSPTPRPPDEAGGGGEPKSRHPSGSARWVTRGEAPSSDHRNGNGESSQRAKPQAQTTGRSRRGERAEVRYAGDSQRAKPQLRPPGTAGGERGSDEVRYAGVPFYESIARNKPHRTINLPDTNGGKSPQIQESARTRW